MGLFDRFRRQPREEAAQVEPRRSRLRAALNRTRAFLTAAFATDAEGLVDEEFFEELVDALVMADVGPQLADELVAGIRRELSERGQARRIDALAAARDVLAAVLEIAPPDPLAAVQ